MMMIEGLAGSPQNHILLDGILYLPCMWDKPFKNTDLTLYRKRKGSNIKICNNNPFRDKKYSEHIPGEQAIV